MSIRPSQQIALALMQSESDDSFTIVDFLQFGKRDTIRRYLNRQTKQGNLLRVFPSIYVKAKDGTPVAPTHPIKLGKTIGRSKNCLVWPLGESALFAYGLLPCRLSTWKFGSTRFLHSISCNGEQYLFRTRVIKETEGWNVNSLSALEAMSLLAHNDLQTDTLRTIKEKLSTDDCRILARKAESLEDGLADGFLALFRLEFDEKTINSVSPNSPRLLFEKCAAKVFQGLQFRGQELTDEEKRRWELRTWAKYFEELDEHGTRG